MMVRLGSKKKKLTKEQKKKNMDKPIYVVQLYTSVGVNDAEPKWIDWQGLATGTKAEADELVTELLSKLPGCLFRTREKSLSKYVN
jgi:hypothetical protein